MKYRIAIVGSPEATSVFSLLGVDIVPLRDPELAAQELYRLKREMHEVDGIPRNVYGVVFITEDLAAGISADDERKLAKGALPAIIPLPSHHSTGYGMARLKRIVERAVGSDILK